MSNTRRNRPSPGWLRLDNAAKIYPAARSRKWMALFRVSITLTEPVDDAIAVNDDVVADVEETPLPAPPAEDFNRL